MSNCVKLEVLCQFDRPKISVQSALKSGEKQIREKGETDKNSEDGETKEKYIREKEPAYVR